jgi:hypothetical protein
MAIYAFSDLDGKRITTELVDNYSGEIVHMEHDHHEIHDGTTFRYADAVTLGSGASQDYLITTPNTTKWTHFTFEADGTAVTTFTLFEASDKTGTTPQSVWNANRNSTTTASTTVHKGTSGGTTDGTALMVYSSGAAGAARNASSVSHDTEIMLKQNTKYIFRVTSGTAGNLCNVFLNWYEAVSAF